MKKIRIIKPVIGNRHHVIRTERLRNSPHGFTLIEVVIAVVILASAFVTLLGLQSAIMTRTIRDEDRQQEMLIARSILAAIEASQEEIEVQDKSMSAEELIDDLLTDVAPKVDRIGQETMARYMARLTVDLWSIPNVKENAMKRIRVAIYPVDQPEDPFEVLYFVPNDDIETG